MTRVVIQLLLAGIVGYSVAMILMALNAETQTHASGFLEGCCSVGAAWLTYTVANLVMPYE